MKTIVQNIHYQLAALLVLSTSLCHAGTTDGALRMEVIAAKNFVVDSNVESPSTNGPSAAHLGVKIYNDGPTALTNVYVKMGDLTNAATGAGTPATFPARTVSVGGSGGYAGTFALQMPGGTQDAVRYIPRIEPGEYVAQYFFVTYPRKDGSGNSVAGAAPDPNDDLWLNYDLWASASDGAATRRVDSTEKVTMRNEISAMANKIWPNTDGKVPNAYLDAIQASLGWRPDSNAPRTGSGVRLEGIWYDLGNVGAGFDNNGDGVPDRNAWMQPVGDPNPALYDPLALRLVKCYGLVVVKLNDGTEQLTPFEDQLYFENIPGNNRGAVGLVYYEFIPLKPGVSSTLSPYQEVASGYDNEKFNGDYGTPGGTFTSTPPSVTFDKNGPASAAPGTNATYTMTASNSGGEGIGFPGLSLPLIFEDMMPAGLVYVAGSATTSNSPPAGRAFSVTWSTDGGATWVSTEPAAASVTAIRWTLDGALDGGATALVQFQAAIPVAYTAATLNNTGCLKLGETGTLACDTQGTLISGINSLGDLVWRDDNRDSVKQAGETGIGSVTVSLYYDANGNGALDTTDTLYATATTNASGIYGFSNLPDAKFIVVVNDTDADLPAGYTLADAVPARKAIDLDSARASSAAVSNLTADWPFIGALVVTKSVTPTVYGAGELISYTIDLENYAVAVPPAVPPTQTSWSSTVTGNRTIQNAANAQGAPDAVVARIDWAANADNLASSGLSFSSPSGTITKVEYVFSSYLSQALVDDKLDLQINGTLFSTFTTAQLNAMVGTTPIERTVDITSKNASWTWPLVQALTGNLKTNKTSAGDTGFLWVDSIGFRVTTTAVPNPTGTYGPSTMDPLPLTDTFDSTKIAFVSASLPPTTTAAGTFTWANAGPLNPGARKTITVNFRALTPPDINANGEPDPTTTTNTATSTGGYFVSGRPTNPGTSNVAVTINPRGEIGDTVFWDINGNGAQNVGEPGLTNVRVTLSNGTETRTDTNGFYIFRSLVDGAYTVTVDTTTLPWTTFSQTKDPDATVNNASTVTINNNDGISTNNSYLDRDFGYDSTLNIISGSIFQDNNGDGDQDAGEAFIAALTVTLLRDADSNGSYETTVTSTTTNTSGYYVFGSLPNGLYRVVATPPASTVQTLDPDLAPGASGDNATNENASGGNLYPNNDFAYKPSGAFNLGDTVWLDVDADGTQDVGEPGIPGISVLLYEDADGDGVVDPEDSLIATQVTNSAGFYQFTGLIAATYTVIVDTLDPQFPAGVIQTADYDATLDSRGKVTLAASITTADFGYAPTGSGRLGDTVFRDSNGNGAQDAGETGIPNISVALWWDIDGNGTFETLVSTTTTSGSGYYLFNNLPDGAYEARLDTLDPDLPSGLVNTTPVTQQLTIAGGVGTVLNGTGTPSDSSLRVDFGFSTLATIGDMVFFDANNNGSQDYTETGIPNVTVQLWTDPNHDGDSADGAVVATTTTATGTGANPAGFYRFGNVAPGWYVVKVVPASLPQSGGLPIAQTSDPDRDGVPASDNSYPGLPAADHADSLIYVGYGANYGGADFGYQPAGVLGDFVWLDLDKDGVQDEGEPGIAGVGILISNGTTTYTVNTDSNGEWSVANVPDGTWTVSVPASNFTSGGPLEFKTATFDADGVANSTVSVVITGGIVSPAGNAWCLVPDASLDLDFGYTLSGSNALSGTVAIHDTGIAGTADDPDTFAEDGTDHDLGAADETEVAGVPVYLYLSDGASGWDFIGSTTTDSAGDYGFTGLPNGVFRVIISTTAAPLNNATLTTTTANAAAIHAAVTSVTRAASSVTQTLTLNNANLDNVDYAFLSNVNYDFGDLPAQFSATTLAQDGARHVIPAGGSTRYLGTAPDADLDGASGPLANGDDSNGSDDESGVTPLNIGTWSNGTVTSSHGGAVTVNVTVPSAGGWLVGYMDFNQDGDFLDAGELILNQAVSASGTITPAFDIPAGTLDGSEQSFYARFRILPSQPALPVFAYAGSATDGEVEDYLFSRPVGASLGNFIWIDSDGDGVFDSNEQGLGGITVSLSGAATATLVTSDGTQDVDGDGITDPAGYYRFTGLAAGSHTVSFTAPAGYTPSYDEDGGTATPDTSTTVALAASEQHLTADFGLSPLTANITGQVRHDLDNDGDLGDPDSGIQTVIVQLWTDPNGDGSPTDGIQTRETLTNASGNYVFTLVPTGRYVVVEIDPAGATSTADVAGPNNNRVPVSLVGPVDNTGNDFLDYNPSQPGTISGSVLADAGHDGFGETGIDAVTVTLYTDPNGDGDPADGSPVGSPAVTGPDGAYSFSSVAPGSYVVVETQPSNYLTETDGDSTSDFPAAPADAANANLTDNRLAANLAPGETDSGNDFVEELPATIGNLVWFDANNNGARDGGEPGLNGVIVTLLDGSGANIDSDAGTPGMQPTTSTTAGGGLYSFGSLPPGNYQLKITTPPAGFPTSSTSTDSADNQEDNDDNGAQSFSGDAVTSPVIALSTGEIETTIDFGFFNPKPTLFANWQALNPLGGQNGPSQNPDGDLYDNLQEFAFCFNPSSGVRTSCPLTLQVNPNGTIDASLTRVTSLQGVTCTLEEIADLKASGSGSAADWAPVTITPLVTSNGNGTETATYKNLEQITRLSGGAGFVRVVVSLDSDGDGNADTTSRTMTMGWNDRRFETQCESCSVSFLKCANFSGSVTDTTAATGMVDVSASAGGLDVRTSLTGSTAYYMEVLNGAHEGHRFEVDAAGSTATALKIKAGSGINTKVVTDDMLNGSSIAVRGAYTLGELFPVTEYQSGASQATADYVLAFEGGAWRTYFLSTLSGGRWIKAGSGQGDQGGRLINPSEGVFIHRRHAAVTGAERPLNAIFTGSVRQTKFASPLAAGYTFLAGGWPVDQGPAERAMLLSNGFIGGRSQAVSDQILLWAGDTNYVPANPVESYTTQWLLNAGRSPYQHWTAAGTAALPDIDAAPVFQRGHAVFMNLRTARPNYVMPVPWTP